MVLPLEQRGVNFCLLELTRGKACFIMTHYEVLLLTDLNSLITPANVFWPVCTF